MSCKCHEAVVHNATQHYTTLHNHTHDTVVVWDSVAIVDSTFTSERQRGDTVYRDRIHYRDRIEYRDRWHERIVHDTIVRTDSIVQVIEHPPKRYVPKFYRWCTVALWTIIAIAIVVVIGRLRLSDAASGYRL